MKRISAFLLAAVVMFTLAGCGGASSQAGTGQPQSAADSAAESSGEVQAESRETDEQVPETESQETGAAESERKLPLAAICLSSISHARENSTMLV